MAKVTLLYPDEVPDRRTDEIEERIWEQIMNGTFGENAPITDETLANIEPIDLTQYMRQDN